jgi:hypothetical protein
MKYKNRYSISGQAPLAGYGGDHSLSSKFPPKSGGEVGADKDFFRGIF